MICILFIGSTKPSLKWLHDKARPLAVRENKIRSTLLWLKKYNTLYENIILDEQVLQSLPENDIFPFHVEHMMVSSHQNSLTSTYDSVRNPNDENHMVDEIPFEKIVITDVEGRTTSKTLGF